MYSNKKWGVSLALFVFTGIVQAQNPLKLSDCVNYAIANNPQVKVARLQIADAEWRIKENKSTGLPQVTASASYTGFLQRGGLPSSALSFGPSGPVEPPASLTNNFSGAQIGGLADFIGGLFQSDPNSKVFFAPVHSISGNIQASQLIFNNSYLVAIKAARFYREYVNDQLAATQQTIRSQVTDAYLPALLLSENVETLDKNIGNLEKLLNDTRAINKAGFAEQLDVDRLDLSIATLRSERGNLVRQRDIVVNVLKMAMGMPVAEQITLSDNVESLMTEYASIDVNTPVNFMQRPEYVQLLKGRELSVLQLELFQKPYLPSVAGFVQYQPGFQGGFGNRNSNTFNKWYFIPSAVAGISVNFTLWDSGTNKARKEKAMIAVQTIDAQKQMLENAILLEAETARKQYANATERVASQQKNVDLARRIYETTQTKYKAGVGSSFEVIQAEQAQYTAQQALMTARYDLLASKVAFKKALGGQ
jgi:outer membrane protein